MVFLTSLADAYFDNKRIGKVKTVYEKVLTLIIENNARNWYINQLKANIEKVDK